MIVVQDIRDYLEGFGIDAATLSDSFIQRRIEATVAVVERESGKSFFEIKEIIEMLSGSGTATLQLLHFPVTEIIKIEILKNYFTPSPGITTGIVPSESYILSAKDGRLTFKSIQSWFPSDENSVYANYKYGYSFPPADAVEGLVNLVCADCLQNVSDREGSVKSLSIEGWSKSYGGDTKFAGAINTFKTRGMEYLINYYEMIL